MRLVLSAATLCGLAFTLGCGMELTKQEGDQRRAAGGGGIAGMAGGDLMSSPTSQPQPAAAPAETAPATSDPNPPAEQTPSSEPPAAAVNSTNPSDPTVSAPSNDPNTEAVAAKRGVGKQGRYEGSGMVVTPIKAYFLTKQRTELEVKVPHALNLYKAEHGHFPKSHEDFMRDIIEFNQVKLPELPAGHRYIYEPKTGELMVERPAQ